MDIDALIDAMRALPDTEESPHHDLCSARVKGRIYATWPSDGSRVHLFFDADRARAIVAGGVGEELWWGKQLAGVRIALPTDRTDDVRALVEEAHARRAKVKGRAGRA